MTDQRRNERVTVGWERALKATTLESCCQNARGRARMAGVVYINLLSYTSGLIAMPLNGYLAKSRSSHGTEYQNDN
ncbi:hypothetical protein M407DRAFT_245094 [Tulasnella calospora MUT 4182]|uniref:Uncharacterized protein n=1 Tax=Tulasnella calospora MUT 4182 TaxID=1051891 RepID=A0A0C3Q2D8_9AGAM|nr:hypothetical protein M407DRAFT_245094 [Tulasnella calospora MUT 4182]